MDKEQRKRAEDYIFYSLSFITVIIFIASPAYMDINSKLDNALNHFIDNYLLGNGYYSPPNYPFAAKITNSFSVVIAIIGSFVMVDKKQVENYIFYSLMMISLVIFIVIPSHASTQFDYYLNDFVDKYLLGNGYYSPSGYPFTSKVLNSFSVALAIVAGTFIGIWRRKDFDIEKMSKYAWPTLLIFVVSGLFTFFLSLNPQEFRESTLRRSFGTSESFHNNPVLFLAMMIGKQMWIYLSIRFSLSFLLCKLSKMKK